MDRTSTKLGPTETDHVDDDHKTPVPAQDDSDSDSTPTGSENEHPNQAGRHDSIAP